MPNPIKYTTGSETLALKKGNFYIGTGDVGKGPSDTTGFYQGVSPVSGGYVIYMNKTGVPGDLSYHNAPTDAELISFTNSLAGQSYTTVNECLVYFSEQTDKVILNRNYEGIVTDGLVLNLDAGFTPSYPKNGTTWYDVGGTNNGTLINGPTYSSNNGGAIMFDGTNDYINLGNPQSLNFANSKSITVSQVIKVDSFINNTTSLMWEDFFGGNGNEPISLRYGWINSAIKKATLLISFGQSLETALDSTTTLQTNTIYFITGTYDGSKMKIYINGTLENEVSETRAIKTPVDASARWFIGTGELNAARWFDGSIYITQIYNKPLSASEVLQNFNAQKGRFGL